MNGIKRTMWVSELISDPSCCLTEPTMFGRFIKEFMVPFLKKNNILFWAFIRYGLVIKVKPASM
jgi:hypothetical protein